MFNRQLSIANYQLPIRHLNVLFVSNFYFRFRSFLPFRRKAYCFPPIVGLCRFYVTLLTLLPSS